MAVYTSAYTGTQIDEGVGKGLSAVQPDTEASLTTLTLGTSPDALTEGQMAWNAAEGTIDIGLNGGEVILQTGQEAVYRVRNQSGATIPNGALLMVVGTNGASGSILVDLADATGAVEAKYILGVATQEILTEDELLGQTGLGYVTHFGKVRGLDTSMWADGDVLWADPAVPGGLTNVRPEAPAIDVPVAFVVNSHPTVGTIVVRVETGANLGDLHNVQISAAPAENSMLIWDGVLGRWSDRVATLNDLENVTYLPPDTGAGQSIIFDLFPDLGLAVAVSDGTSTSSIESLHGQFVTLGSNSVTGDQRSLDSTPAVFQASGGNFGTSQLYSFDASPFALSFVTMNGANSAVLEAGNNGLTYAFSDGVTGYFFEAINSLGVLETNYAVGLIGGLSAFGATPVTAQPAPVENIQNVGLSPLPAPDGEVSFVDTATPTPQELLDYIVELEAKVKQLVTIVEAYGLVQERTLP